MQSMKVQFQLNPKLIVHTTAFSFPLKSFKTYLLPPDVGTINRLVCIMCNSSFGLQFYVFKVLKTNNCIYQMSTTHQKMSKIAILCR